MTHRVQRKAWALTATGLLLVATGGLSAMQPPAAHAAGSAAATYSIGDGDYINTIFWIDWNKGQNFATEADVPANMQINANTLKVGTWVEIEAAPQYFVKATVTEIGGQTAPNSVGLIETGGTNNQLVWARVQDPVYSQVSRTGYTLMDYSVISPYGDGGNVSVKVQLEATFKGEPVPVDAIFTDGEESNAGENINATSDGAPWIPLFNTQDTRGGSLPMWSENDARVNSGFFTQNFGNFTDNGRRVPIGMSRDTKNITISINSAGMQNAMLGFYFPTEAGDAPVSYGDARARLPIVPTAEQTTVNPKQDDDSAPDAPRLRNETTVYLGRTQPLPNPEMGSMMHEFTPWTLDDVTTTWEGSIVNDENLADLFESGAFPALAQCTTRYGFTVRATAPDGTPVAAWIDSDNSGTFDPTERVASTVQGGLATLTFENFAVAAGLTDVGSRIWISSDAASLQTPIGLSPDGEVQDHLIPVTDTCTPTTTTGLQGQAQTSDAKTMFPDTDLAGAAFNFGKDATGGPILSQPAVDASGATVGNYTIDPATGVVTFTPNRDYIGTPVPVTVRVDLSNGNTFESTYTPTVTPVTPAATPDTTTTPKGSAVTLTPLTNDTAGDSTVPLQPETVKLTAAGLPADATVAPDGKSAIVPGQGTYTVNDGGTVTFTPEPNFVGTTTTVTYTVQDANGTPTSSTLTVTVVGVADVSRTGEQGKAVAVPPALEGVDPATVVLLPDGLPGGSTVAEGGKSATVPGEGTWTVDGATGVMTFTPEDGFTGDPTPIRYTGADTPGGVTVPPATVTVQYPDVEDVTQGGNQGTPVTVKPPLDADTIPGTLTLIPDGLPAGSTVAEGGKSATVPGEGTWTVANDGSLTFTPENGFTGNPTPIKFTAADKDGNTATPGTATITYPDVEDVTQGGNQSTPVTVKPPMDEDTIPGTLTLLPNGLPNGSTVSEGGKSATVPGEGTWTVTNDGSITFTPEDGFTGDPTPITFTAADKDGNTATPGTATITTSGSVSTVEKGGPQGTPVTLTPPRVNVPPTTLVLLPNGLPNGSTVSEGGKSATVPGEGTWVVNNDGSLTFTPEDGFPGDPTPITFTGTGTNGNPVPPATATVTYPDVENVTGGGEPNKPVTVKPPMDEDTIPGTLTLLPNGLPNGSTVSEGGKSATVPGEGTWTVTPDGSITFTPVEGFTGNPTPITFTAADKDGDTATPGTATITYTSKPAPPGNTGTAYDPVAPKPPTILPSWLARTGVNGYLAGGITAALVAAGVVLTVLGRRRRQK